MPDTEIRVRGLEALTEALGTVRAERFVTLLLREPFDYTEWQKGLWPNETVESLSKVAMRHRKAAQRRDASKTSR